PFSAEWSGGSGINEHNKFVVTDFNLPTARVYTGSSNLSPSGETNNGDNLVVIQDQRTATSYAINALRIFDHLHFRSRMKQASALTPHAEQQALTLQKPIAISGLKQSWFATSYIAGDQAQRDRLLFSH
ncbi:MAG TPA: phospholipase D-like domain-containing protein, partial [Edaphobacter sp.]|nr:phospholipase D-like domain-containing protein [Edaphobacter sp.]